MDLTFVKEIFFELLVGVYPHNLDKLDDVLRLIKPVVISHAAIELLFAIFESEGEFGNYKKITNLNDILNFSYFKSEYNENNIKYVLKYSDLKSLFYVTEFNDYIQSLEKVKSK